MYAMLQTTFTLIVVVSLVGGIKIDLTSKTREIDDTNCGNKRKASSCSQCPDLYGEEDEDYYGCDHDCLWTWDSEIEPPQGKLGDWVCTERGCKNENGFPGDGTTQGTCKADQRCYWGGMCYDMPTIEDYVGRWISFSPDNADYPYSPVYYRNLYLSNVPFVVNCVRLSTEEIECHGDIYQNEKITYNKDTGDIRMADYDDYGPGWGYEGIYDGQGAVHWGSEGHYVWKRDPCIPSPCLNGGTCVKTSDTNFECKCPSGWSNWNCAVKGCKTARPNLPGQTGDGKSQGTCEEGKVCNADGTCLGTASDGCRNCYGEENCNSWANYGYCEGKGWDDWMAQNCAKACDHCEVKCSTGRFYSPTQMASNCSACMFPSGSKFCVSGKTYTVESSFDTTDGSTVNHNGKHGDKYADNSLIQFGPCLV